MYRLHCSFIIVQSFFIIIMIIPSNLTQLVNSYSLAVWIFYGLVFVGLLIMRVTHKDVPRPYKVCECMLYVSVVAVVYLNFANLNSLSRMIF